MCVSDRGTATNPAYPVFDGKTGKILPRGANPAYAGATQPKTVVDATPKPKPKPDKKTPAPTAKQLALKNRLGVVFEYQKSFR